ncbi:hypothetical protein LCGC14_2997250, partial [marine sediment metagenome]
YVPTILMIAVIIYFFTNDIYRSISALVISCPCALILATPTAMVASLSAAARLGILVKNVSLLEIAGKITAIVFDKTGTLTTGKLFVTKLEPANDTDPAELLGLAASAEQMSKNPAARALVMLAKEANVSLNESSDFEEVPGKGVTASVGSHKVLVGRDTFLKENGIDMTNVSDPSLHEEQGFSTLYVSRGNQCIGWVGLQDKVRAEARSAVDELLAVGVKRVTMLTGDRAEVANRVSAELGCTDYKAHCLPHDKLAVVEKIKADGHIVAVVGDGINDAPALVAADLSIAVRSAGQLCKETADITIMRSDPGQILDFLKMAEKVNKKIHQNLIYAFIYNILSIPIAMSGLLSPLVAVCAMLFSSLS